MPELAALAKDAADILKAHDAKIAVTESSTGGLISAALLAVPGASAYFEGGSVVYTLASRKEILRITRDDVKGMEPLTESMVLKFAEKAADQLQTTWGIAELGVAGPTGARYGHPPGISVIGVYGPSSLATTVETNSDDREANMWQFTASALDLLTKQLKQHYSS